MPSKKSHRGKGRTPKQEPPVQLKISSGSFEVNSQELKAKAASPMPSREASVDCSEASLIGDIQDPEHVDQGQEHVSEIVRSPLQNHDRMDSGRRYCFLTTIHAATHQGHRALLKPMWNPACITHMMSDDLDITEVVDLDHITAILHVGQWSTSEGLTQEKAQACIDHFNPYIEWRDMAVEHEFQALTLAEAQEEIQAYEAQSLKPI